MQKINFITHFFFKILQRNSKIVTLGNLGMTGPTHLKWQYKYEETFHIYLQAENHVHPFRFPWDIAKILPTCHIAYFGHAWLPTSKMIPSTRRQLSCLSVDTKNQLHPSRLSGDIAKICKYCKLLILATLGMFGYAHPNW